MNIGDGYGKRERTGKGTAARGRSIAFVSIVAALIAAIAFVNSGGSQEDNSDAENTAANSTAPSGETPVTAQGTVPTGYPHSRQGAQSAAANYAVALGGEGMFNPTTRRKILQTISAPGAADVQSRYTAAYGSLNKQLGLRSDGSAPKGSTFVSRTMPAGAKTTKYSDTNATVAVWCSGLIGLAGPESKNPVTTSWFTLTLKLKWSSGDWKVAHSSQTEGPTPNPGDDRVSDPKEIGKASKEYGGGFTYTR